LGIQSDAIGLLNSARATKLIIGQNNKSVYKMADQNRSRSN